ncbi:phospholipid-transporting ATPase, putative [Entamoeba invadens IP1]|uniref:Phospholipid-transporting ATPase n=1 Tax=Entamoeba invadens IP1 TaxID=370355 RepID=A0A0A1U8L1_ENTIV|nr:phospholipid-transporting ATPase, putative [Entamoeba invadens IP1]ELP91244.1 phospholipid-transporting ATPase, putative [Entamoeba invadens IP1]|eukprot:XP_004258015.1 phospholipid-transporting ATPase, putative [Entamoeba invadens IP1]
MYNEETKSFDTKVKWSQITSGQILKIDCNQIIPADIVPLVSTNENGIVYVQTTALDGETDFKSVLVPSHFQNRELDDISNIEITLHTERPTPSFESFKAYFEEDKNKISLSSKNLLLQGTVLKNTDSVMGVVCYCGSDTKLSLNQTKPRLKKSTTNSRFNQFVLFMIVFQTVVCLLLAVFSALDFKQYNDLKNGFWYLSKEDISPVFFGVKKFFGFFTLMNNMIPISCQVTLETVKFLQGIFIEIDNDLKMDILKIECNKDGDMNEKIKKVGARANSTILNDELGLAKYVLSDKTGTLTENCMVFKGASIHGKSFEESDLKNSECEIENTQKRELLLCMSLCNSVEVKNNEFCSNCPDEECLCIGAKMNHVELIFRSDNKIAVKLENKREEYKVLCVIPFSSYRKRMSVLLRDKYGGVTLWMKGADEVIFSLARDSRDNFEDERNIEDFSKEGFRTLLFAKREITETYFGEWFAKYENVIHNFEDDLKTEARKVELEKEIESDLTILGASKIEDKLQEGVKETIEMLKRGGLKVWVITGDRLETALNIGNSCGLIQSDIFCVKEIENLCETLEQIKRKLQSNLQNQKGENGGSGTVVIEGKLFETAENLHFNELSEVIKLSDSLICCRVTPLQKALIAKTVQKITKEIVITIGDGANDVPMINTGNVGIGIFGKEGTQAARASDFAIRRFKDIGKLVLFHGRECLYRNSLLIKLCFYKNIAMFFVLFYLAFLNNFSCETIYDDYMVALYNTFFTAIPPLLSAVFDKDVEWKIIKKVPQLNREMLLSKRSAFMSFVNWFVFGIYQSLVFFFFYYITTFTCDVTMFGLNGGIPYTSGLFTLGIILTILITMALQTKTWNYVLVFGHVISVVLTLLVFIVLSFYPNLSMMNFSWYGLVVLFQQPHFYLSVFAMVFMSVLPLLVNSSFKILLNPNDYDVARELFENKMGKKALNKERKWVQKEVEMQAV